jgi:hypothetical protein
MPSIEPFKGGFAVKGPVLLEDGTTETQVITRTPTEADAKEFLKRAGHKEA